MRLERSNSSTIRRTARVAGVVLFAALVMTRGGVTAEDEPPSPDAAAEVTGVEATVKEMQQFEAVKPSPEPRPPRNEKEIPGIALVPGIDRSKLNIVGKPPLEPGPAQGPIFARPGAMTEASPLASPPLQSFVGMVDDTLGIPPDTHGAAGPSHLVSLLNRGFAVFNKATGAIVSGPISLQSFWSSLGTGNGQPAQFPFDPRVLYDQFTSRFVAVSLGQSTGSNNNWILFAVSQTSDPTGAWNLYAIDAESTAPSTTGFKVDFPGLGLDANGVYVTVNLFSASTGAFGGTKWYVVRKPYPTPPTPITVNAYRVGSNGSTLFDGASWQPAHTFGATSPASREYFAAADWTFGGTSHLIKVKRIDWSGGLPTAPADIGYIVLADWGVDTPEDAPQPGCVRTIEVGSASLQNLVFRSETGMLYTTNTVDDPLPDGIGKSEVAWYRFSPAKLGCTGGACYYVDEQGRVSTSDRWHFYPSIAVNSAGCIALGFSGSGDVLPSAYYTSRQPSDPWGFMRPPVLLKGGEDTYYKTLGGGRNRWGDFSATSVDPSDGLSFWTIQEYSLPEAGGQCPTDNTGRWGTWWGQFSCACVSGADCDDGSFCSGAETCSGGNCLAGVSPSCADAEACTTDVCGPATILYSEDFETGAPGWSHQPIAGGSDTWHLATGTCTGGDPAFSSTMYVSNGNAGPACNAVGTRENSMLESPPIALPAVAPGEVLALFFDALSYDYAGTCIFPGNSDAHEARISVDGGTTYAPLNGCTLLTDGAGGRYTSAYDVTTWAGAPAAQFAFFYDVDTPSTDLANRHAFAIDDVSVERLTDLCVNFTLPNGTPCDDAVACTAGDACTAGVCAGAAFPPPGEVRNLQALPSAGDYVWDAEPASAAYDVVRGDVSALPVGVGAGDETCFQDVPATSLTDPAVPPSRQCYFYVVRGDTAGCLGPYGNGHTEPGPPENGPPRVTTTCP